MFVCAHGSNIHSVEVQNIYPTCGERTAQHVFSRMKKVTEISGMQSALKNVDMLG